MPFDRVVIGPHTYSVHFVDRLSKKRRVGEANVVENTIAVRNDQAASMLRSTLLHEVGHHICFTRGLRNIDGFTDEIEEAVCCAFEGPLLELFTRSGERSFEGVASGPLILSADIRGFDGAVD